MTYNTHLLEDVVECFIDYRGKTPSKTTSGIPLVTAKIVKNGTVQKPEEFISEEDYPKWMTRGYPQMDDVILTTEAPLGEVALVDDENIALAQRIITIRGKQGILDSVYLKYWLQSDKGQHELHSRATGTTVLGIKAAVLKKIPITLPPLVEQVKIGQMLRVLDDKIELNNQLNHNLAA